MAEKSRAWGRATIFQVLQKMGFWAGGVLGLLLVLGLTAQAKQITDSLTTDFQAGNDDNILINQGILGSVQLAPFTMLNNWVTNAGPASSLYLASSVVYNGKVYVSGGEGQPDTSGNGTTPDSALSAIHFGNILSNGTIDKWDPDKLVPLQQPTYGHTSVVVNGRLYIIGGRAVDSTTLASVYWGKIFGFDGQIKPLYTPNTWTAVASLPVPLYRPVGLRFEKWIYVIGGVNSGDIAQNTVYYAQVAPNGDIPNGAWQTTSAPLPSPLSGHNAVISNGRIYVIGGSTTGQPQDAQNQIIIGNINPVNGDIPAWVPTTPLPTPLYESASAICGGRIWVCGGANSTTAVANNVVYFAGLNQADGTIPGPNSLNTWSRGTDLPIPIKWHNMVSFNNHLLVVGGTNNTGIQKQIMTTTLVPDQQNLTSFLPTTPMFLTSYGGGARDIWAGHTAVVKNPLPDQSVASTTGGKPVVYVLGGGANTYCAYASGSGDTTTPAGAYNSVYKSTVDSNGALETWNTDVNNGFMPMAAILATSVLAVNNQVYVIGGANSANAVIFAGAASRSDTAFYEANTPTGWFQGHTDVFYENIGAGSTTGSFQGTSFIPLVDPNWTTANAGGNCFQPLIKAASVQVNDVIYVLGGISRVNQLPVVNSVTPASIPPGNSDPDVQDKVWFAIPNAAGDINTLGGPGGWKLTTTLPQPMYDCAVCAVNNFVYVFGGRDAQPGVSPSVGSVLVHPPRGNPLNSVYFAPINLDGSLGPWTATTPMLLNLAEHQVIYASGRIYVLGGSSDAAGGSLQNAVFYSMPSASTGQIPNTGFFGTWQMTSTGLEHPVAGHQVVTNNGYIYVLGGRYNGVLHSSSAYYMGIASIAYQQTQIYAWGGTFERFIDLNQDQFVDTLDWQVLPNNETFTLKCRTALDSGPWTDWTPAQALGPINVHGIIRYLHYKITLQTAHNAPGAAASPIVNQVILNYFPSKYMDYDSFEINHNKFDPQLGPLSVSFKTRSSDVANVIIRVYNLEGVLIRRQDFNYPAGTPLPVSGYWQWDGTNNNQQYVANGVYIIQYNSGDTHKTRKVIIFKR